MISERRHTYRLLFILSSIILFGLILRLSYLTQIPPALHGDELGTGYNAYSLLKTGRDEYANLLPLTFRNDFSPLIFYATVASTYLLGLTEFATRLPSALIGIFSIISFFILSYRLYANRKLALLCAFLLTVSSWHIRSSRVGLEMIWALFFQISGAALFIQSVKGKTRSFLLPFLLFTLSILSYQSAKMTTPLLILGLFIIYRNQIGKDWKKLISLFVFCIILPILIYFLVRPIEQNRFLGISVFTEWKASIPKELSLFSPDNLWILAQMMGMNYLKHFDPRLLFFDNSTLRYYQLSGLGLFYPWQNIFIILGFIYSIRLRIKRENQMLLLWLLLSPLPASLTTGVPYANIGRNLMMFPGVEVFCALGLMYTFRLFSKQRVKRLKLVLAVFVSILASSWFLFFLLSYRSITAEILTFWGKPLKKVILQIQPHQESVEKIIISSTNPQAYMYFLFYNQVDPLWLFTQTVQRAKVVGYSTIGKYEFRPTVLSEDLLLPSAIIVTEHLTAPKGSSLKILKTNR